MPTCKFVLGSLLILTLALTSAGCRRKAADADAPPERNPLMPVPGQAPAQSDVRRGGERQLNQSSMRQILLFYTQYCDTNGSPPKTLEEFLNYIKTDGRTEYQLLQAGTVVLVLNVRPSSSQVWRERGVAENAT